MIVGWRAVMVHDECRVLQTELRMILSENLVDLSESHGISVWLRLLERLEDDGTAEFRVLYEPLSLIVEEEQLASGWDLLYDERVAHVSLRGDVEIPFHRRGCDVCNYRFHAHQGMGVDPPD